MRGTLRLVEDDTAALRGFQTGSERLGDRIDMKKILKISMVLNLGLLGGLVFVLAGGRKPVSDSLPPAAFETRRLLNEVAATPQPTPTRVEPKPFHWSQLESTNYQVYVKNLRTVGCPEPTLWAIVKTDVYSAFSQRRQELRQKITDLASGSGSLRLETFNAEQKLKVEIQQLNETEAAEIARLMGWQAAPATVAATDSKLATAPGRRQQAAPAPVVMPIAFHNLDHTGVKLDDGQLQAISELRQSFIEKIGGVNQDPNDPAYLERWQKAQPEMDNLLQGMIGSEAFQNIELQASARANDETTEKP
jgi:hypothetical protein